MPPATSSCTSCSRNSAATSRPTLPPSSRRVHQSFDTQAEDDRSERIAETCSRCITPEITRLRFASARQAKIFWPDFFAVRGWSFWRWEECGGVCPNNHTCRRKFSRPRPRARIVRRPALMHHIMIRYCVTFGGCIRQTCIDIIEILAALWARSPEPRYLYALFQRQCTSVSSILGATGATANYLLAHVLRRSAISCCNQSRLHLSPLI